MGVAQNSSSTRNKQNELNRVQKTFSERKDLNKDVISRFSKDFIFSNLKKRVIIAQEKIPHPHESMYFEKYLNRLSQKSATNSIMIEAETPEKFKNVLRQNKKYSLKIETANNYNEISDNKINLFKKENQGFLTGESNSYFLRKSSNLLRNKIFINEVSFDAISMLPSNILIKIICFTIEGFRKYLCVSPSWYISITNCFDEHFNAIENAFVNKFSSLFAFKDSFTCSSLIKCSDKSKLRVDRVLVCENISKINNATIHISFMYKYVSNPHQFFRSEYVFDSLSKRNRYIWIYKNECKFHFDEEGRSYSQPISSICLNDFFEFSINFYSMQGLIDIKSIIWEDVWFEELPKDNMNNYNITLKIANETDTARKLFADFGRICELEDSEIEWFDASYYHRGKKLPNLKSLLKNFLLQKIEFSEIDITVFKVHMLANKEGIIRSEELGIEIRVKSENDYLINEIKRKGLIIDRNAPLELRIGDFLVLYISNDKL